MVLRSGLGQLIGTHSDGQGPSRHKVDLQGYRPPPESVIPEKEAAFRLVQVKSVRVLPPREKEGGRPTFNLQLSLETEAQPSSLQRRTGTVSHLEIEVEEKEVLSLIRLSGRMIRLRYILWTEDVEVDFLQKENTQLKEEAEHLKGKLRSTQDQLQFLVENQIKETRS